VAKLIYSAITSLDLYVNDVDGSFAWAEPSEEVHAFVNEQERPIGTHLLGRSMYEVMRYWETAATTGDDAREVSRDYAQIWQATDKVVFSRTLTSVVTKRTRLEHDFDLDLVRELKASSDRDLSIGGPTLAAIALAAGLVDECHLYLNPVVVGGGTAALPDGWRAELELLDEHRFANGVVHLHHAVRSR
jgi:dihydrofolate reductase